MKIATIVVRTLMGLLFLFASVTYFLNAFEQPVQTGALKIYMDGIMASGYLMPLVKGTELVVGLVLVSGRFTALATVVIFPITVNILCVHAFLAPEGLPVAAALMLANLFLAYAHRDKYAPLLQAK